MHHIKLSLTIGALLAGAAFAQNTSGPATPPHVRMESNLDSGYLDNLAPAARVVFRQRVRHDQTAWLQFRFGEATNLPDGSFVRLTSALDHDFQLHTGATIVEWASWSAAFNGNEVDVELVAGPNTKANRVVFDQEIRGLVDTAKQETICGPTDDRVQSNDKRQGRLWIGCTGWLIGPGGGTDILLSAGHCVTGGPFILELNVPNSTAGGSIVRASVNDQYPFTVQGSLNAGVGQDWSVSVCGKNSNTGLYPTQANGGVFYNLGTVPGGAAGNNIRITGYGVSGIPTLTQVQKTHVGPLSTIGATSLCYATDTTGGNSGSPVIHENTGRPIGIHTHGGCTSTGGCNSGTRIDRSDLQAAIAAAGKTPGKFITFGAGCPGTGTRPSNCATINGSGGTLAGTTAPNEYAYVMNATSALSVTGFEIYSRSNTGGSVTVQAGIYADAGGAPAANAIATASMTIGATAGFYQATFAAPVAIPAGAFYVAVDHSATTTLLATLTSGTSGSAFWRRPPFGGGSWSPSGLVPFPSVRVQCAGGGGSGAVPAIGNNGVAEVGKSFAVEVGFAAAGAPAILFTGFSNRFWGRTPLPFSLAPFGAKCNLLVDPLISSNALTSRSGTAAVKIPVPGDRSLIGVDAFHQWFIIDRGANPLGVAVSNGGQSTIGG